MILHFLFNTTLYAMQHSVALDVAVVNPCKGGTVVEAAAGAGFALNDTFKSKMQKSAEACQREGVIFMPMVTESFGGWHEVAVTEVERLGAALASQSVAEHRYQSWSKMKERWRMIIREEGWLWCL